MKGLLIAGLMIAALSVTREHPPVLVTRPSVDNGTPTGTGITLTATVGSYSHSPTSYVREWRRNGVAISGATGLTYVTASADQGKYLSFYEKAVNASGDSGFVRATTGNPRQLFLISDSLMASVDMAPAIQSALDAQFGTGAVKLINFSVSGQNYDVSAQNFELMSEQSVDINIDTSWGLVISFDYANQFTGLQGSDSGATGLSTIYTYAATRTTAGAVHIYCTSPYPNGTYHGGIRDGSAAYIASQAIAGNYLSHNGVALVDFRDATLFGSIDANDGIHWTSEVYPNVAVKIVQGMVNAKLSTGCGGAYVPPTTGVNLKTYSNDYYFDPVQRLPWPIAASSITTTNANSWVAKTSAIGAGIEWFNTGVTNGWQTFYYSVGWQSHPLSGGHYTLNP